MSLILGLLLVTAIPVALVLGARHLLRRTVSPTLLEHAEKVVPFVLGSIGGFFGLVAGFMLSTSWVEVRALRSAMTEEVNALVDIEDIAVNLPQPRADSLKHAVARYLQHIVNEELPAMREGRTSASTARALDDLWRPLSDYQPDSQWEVSLREIAIVKVMSIGEQRRQRIVASRERLPALLWGILVGAGLVVVSGACVVSLRYRFPTEAFLGSLTTIVALVLFSIFVLERPFQYELTTEASEYRMLWKVLGGGGHPLAP